MVIVEVSQGLGNQLFMYACAYALAKERNDELMIENSSYYLKDDSTCYMLDKFSVSCVCLPIATPKKNLLCFKIKRLLIKNKFILGYCKYVNTEEVNNYYKYIPIKSSQKHVVLRGYWQNYRYFDKYRTDILKEFRINVNFISDTAIKLSNEIKDENSVAIHIRKGDYPIEWRVEDSFYYKALDFITKKIRIDNIYIFCQDKKFANQFIESLPQFNVIDITHNRQYSDLEEFYLMSSCRNLIISNSTFSWWAAYICDNENKIVIAPKMRYWDENFYYKDWIVI